MEGQPWMPQRFPFDPAVSTVSQRMPAPDQRFQGPFPSPQLQQPQSFPQTTGMSPSKFMSFFHFAKSLFTHLTRDEYHKHSGYIYSLPHNKILTLFKQLQMTMLKWYKLFNFP